MLVDFSEDELHLIERACWKQIECNRKANIGDFSDESEPFWKLKTKIENILYPKLENPNHFR